jgi:hypothetical protein
MLKKEISFKKEYFKRKILWLKSIQFYESIARPNDPSLDLKLTIYDELIKKAIDSFLEIPEEYLSRKYKENFIKKIDKEFKNKIKSILNGEEE